MDRRTRGCKRTCLARRRRTGRSRAADADARSRGCARPTSCCTTRSIDERILRYARHAQRFFVGKRAGRHALSQDGDPRADDSRGAARPPRRAAEGRRSVRVRPRRRGSAGAAARRRSVRRRAGRHQRRRGAGAGRHSGDASRRRVRVPRRRRATTRTRSRRRSAQLQPNGVTLVVLMGLGRSRGDCRPADRSRLVARHAGGDHRRRVAAGAAGVARHARRSGRGRRREVDGDGAGTIVIGDVVAIGMQVDGEA